MPEREWRGWTLQARLADFLQVSGTSINWKGIARWVISVAAGSGIGAWSWVRSLAAPEIVGGGILVTAALGWMTGKVPPLRSGAQRRRGRTLAGWLSYAELIDRNQILFNLRNKSQEARPLGYARCVVEDPHGHHAVATQLLANLGPGGSIWHNYPKAVDGAGCVTAGKYRVLWEGGETALRVSKISDELLEVDFPVSPPRDKARRFLERAEWATRELLDPMRQVLAIGDDGVAQYAQRVKEWDESVLAL